jgi:phage protein D
VHDSKKSPSAPRKHGDAQDHEFHADELYQVVQEVYERCIGNNESNLSTLQMLTKIEKRLDELFEAIDALPPEYLAVAERTKDKERRQKLRQEKMEQQKKAQENRIKRALERSQAPTKKKAGKPVMFRSVLIKKKKETNQTSKKLDEEKEEQDYFFSW